MLAVPTYRLQTLFVLLKTNTISHSRRSRAPRHKRVADCITSADRKPSVAFDPDSCTRKVRGTEISKEATVAESLRRLEPPFQFLLPGGAAFREIRSSRAARTAVQENGTLHAGHLNAAQQVAKASPAGLRTNPASSDVWALKATCVRGRCRCWASLHCCARGERRICSTSTACRCPAVCCSPMAPV